MGVTTEQVLHVAALARLRLTPAEVERFTTQLNDILGHVEEMGTLAEAPVVPAPSTEAAPLRDDDAPPDALAFPPAEMAPAWEDGFFTLPRLAALDAAGAAEADEIEEPEL